MESGAGNYENTGYGSFCAYHTKSGSLPAFLYRNAGHGAKRNKWEVYIAVWRTKDKYTHAPGGIPAGGGLNRNKRSPLRGAAQIEVADPPANEIQLTAFAVSCYGIRQRPTLPGRLQPSTIGTEGLNFCVRYGNRWNPFVITTGKGDLFYFRALTTA